MADDNKPNIVIHNGSGGLDRDTSFILADQNGNAIFNANDYTDAVNMRPLSTSQNNSFDNEVILGNGFKVFAIGTQSDQEQICTFNLQQDNVGVTLTITLFNGSGEVLLSVSPLPISPCTYEDFYDAIVAAINLYSADYAFSAYDPLETFATITNTYGDSFKLLLQHEHLTTGITDYEYAVITQEAINIGLNDTYLTPISSADILGDLFILSTTSSEDGVGELGVMTFDGFNYTYTRLLRSIELGLGWLHLPELTGEKNDIQTNLYFVDANGFDRTIVYKGAYVTDGCLNYINSENFYEYGYIDLQTRQQKFATNTTLTFSNQDNTGGTLPSGTYRYANAFYDNEGNMADITLLGNPIECSPYFWYGGSDGEATNNINNLYVQGAIPSVFPFVRLVVVHYLNTSVSIYMLPKVATSIAPFSLTHNGSEQTETLTASELGLQNNQILHSQNNLILNQRYVKSNFVTRNSDDFSEAAKLLTLSTVEVLSSCEDPFQTSATIVNDGNYDPSNQQYLYYMDNETYRIGLMVEYLNGQRTQVFHIGDITIDPSSFTDKASLTTDNGSIGGSQLINRAIQVDNWASFWGSLPIGVTVNDIAKVHIVRVPCVKEVLATGLGMSCANKYLTYYSPNYLLTDAGGSNEMFTTRNRAYQHFMSPDLMMNNDFITFTSGDKVFSVEQFQNFGANSKNVTGAETVLVDYYKDTFTYNSYLISYSGYLGATDYTSTDIDNAFTIQASVKSPKELTISNASASGDRINLTVTDYLAQNLITQNNTNGYTYFNYIAKSMVLTFAADLGTTYFGKYIQYFRPLTNKYGDAKDNNWIPTNYSQDSNVTTPLVIAGGDTYTQKTVFRLSEISANTNNGNANLAYSFFSQNRVNTTLRGYGGIPSRGVGSAGWNAGIGFFMEQQAEEPILHYKQYDARNNEQVFSSYDYTIPYNNQYLARIIYSLVKPINSAIDNYLTFLPLNYRDLNMTDGAISHMAIDNGELVTFQQRKYQHQYFNNDGLVKSNDTYDLIIGDGSVLSRRGQTISNYGTKFKWSVVKGKSRGGDDIFMFWDTELRAIIKKGAEGVNVVSDSDRLNRFLQPMMAIIDKGNTAVLDWGSLLSGVYDQRNKEFVWTARAIKAQYLWETDVPRSKGDIVYIYPTTDVTFDGLPRVFRSNVNSNITNPLSGISPDWTELVGDEAFACFTLVYSLVKEKFTAFYNFRPRLFMQWKDTYLTPSPSDIVTPTPPDNILEIHTDEVFLNDNGRASSFYESIQSSYFNFPLLANTSDPYRLDCVGIETYLVNSDVYKYAIWYEPTDTYYYIREVNTDYVVLYEPYTGSDMTSGEAKMVLCWSEEPYIEFLTNLDPVSYKRPHALQVQSNNEPIGIDFELINQQSFVTNRNANRGLRSDFQDLNGAYRAGFPDDTTNNPTNNRIEGSRLISAWWKSKVKFMVGTVSRINQYVVQFNIVKRGLR